VVNKANDLPISQNNANLRPGWSATAFNGTPGLIFTGTQYLLHNYIANLASTASGIPAITIIAACQKPVQAAALYQVVNFGLSTSTYGTLPYAFPGLGLNYSYTYLGKEELYPSTADNVGDESLLTPNVPFTDTKPHVFSMYCTPSSILYKIDGISYSLNISPVHYPDGNPATIKQCTFDTLSIGAIVSAGVVNSPMIGNIGTVLIYQGNVSSPDVENFVMNYHNIPNPPAI
jgi:hypothetical protein